MPIGIGFSSWIFAMPPRSASGCFEVGFNSGGIGVRSGRVISGTAGITVCDLATACEIGA
jgi:hypothetical protein